VCLVGYVRLPDKITLNKEELLLNKEEIENLFSKLRLGGSRKRGRGLVRFDRIEDTAICPDGFSAITINKNETLVLAPGSAVRKEQSNVDGRAVLETYRQFDNTSNKGSGRRFTDGKLCWEVGSVMNTVNNEYFR
jgi:hypothetical protein